MLQHLSDDQWAYAQQFGRRALEAHEAREFPAELRLVEDFARFIASQLGVAGLESMVLQPVHIESALALCLAESRERLVLIELTAKLGVMRCMLGDPGNALGFLRMAREHLPGLADQLEAQRARASPQENLLAAMMLRRLEIEVAGMLEIAYNELGQTTVAASHRGEVTHTDPMLPRLGTYGVIVSVLRTLDSVTRIQKDGRGADALQLLAQLTAELPPQMADSWVADILTAKRTELAAVAAGNHMAARSALIEQIAALERGEGTVPDALRAGALSDMMLYAMRAGRSDVVHHDAGQALRFVSLGSSGPRGASWRIFGSLFEFAEAYQRRWAGCLFLKLALAQLHSVGRRLAEVAPELADSPDDEFEMVHDLLAAELIGLDRISEAAEIVQLSLARGSAALQPSLTPQEAESARQIEHAIASAVTPEAVAGIGQALLESSERVEAGGRAREAATQALNQHLRQRSSTLLPAGTAGETALLFFVVSKEAVLAIVRIGEQEFNCPLDVDSRWVSTYVADTARELSTPHTDPRPLLERGYDALIRPLLDWLSRVFRLVIAAPGALHNLPWGALFDGHHYLAERWLWVRATAPVIDLLTLPAERLSLVACASTRATESLEPLGQSVVDEVNRISQGMSAVRLVDGQFTRQKLRAELGSSSVLHIASHFLANAADPEQSRILLGDGSLATLAELFTSGLEGLDLVVLSACNSGLGTAAAIRDHAFAVDAILLAGGARATITTLWPVNSTVQTEWMSEFYAQLRAGADKDEAIATVQRVMISGSGYQAFQHPHHWAAVTLSGNWLGWRIRDDSRLPRALAQ